MPRKKNDFKLDVISVRLVKDAPILSNHKIITPQDALDIIGNELCEMDREVVCVINLKSDLTPINCHFASIGALNEAIVHPRELFKASILSNAASMILVHSHPSGTLLPSKQDVNVTDRLIEVCGIMGIPLLDHVIVGGDNREFFSFKQKGIMPNPSYLLRTDYQELEFKPAVVLEKGKKR